MNKTIKITLASIFFCLSQAVYAADASGAGASNQPLGNANAAAQPMVILISSDADEFQVTEELARTSSTLTAMWSDTPMDNKISLPGIPSETLRNLIPLWEFSVANPHLPLRLKDQLARFNLQQHIDLSLAAEYLELPSVSNALKSSLITDVIAQEFIADPTIINQFHCDAFLNPFLNFHFTTIEGDYIGRHYDNENDNDAELEDIAITPDGATIVSATENLVYLWRKRPDGTYINEILPATQDSDMGDNSDTDEEEVLKSGQQIQAVTISQDGEIVAAVDALRLRIWQRQPDNTYEYQENPLAVTSDLKAGPLAISRDKSTIVCSDLGDLAIVKRQQDGSYQLLSKIDSPSYGDPEDSITISDDGSRITSEYEESTIIWQENQANDPEHRYEIVEQLPRRPGEYHRSKTTAIIPQHSITVRIDDRKKKFVTLSLDRNIINRFKHASEIAALDITPNTSTLVCGHQNGDITVWLKEKQEITFLQHLLIKMIENAHGNLNLVTLTKAQQDVIRRIIGTTEPRSFVGKFVTSHITGL